MASNNDDDDDDAYFTRMTFSTFCFSVGERGVLGSNFIRGHQLHKLRGGRGETRGEERRRFLLFSGHENKDDERQKVRAVFFHYAKCIASPSSNDRQGGNIVVFLAYRN